MAFKIMLVYPNSRGMNLIPSAMGLLSAVLKRAGYQVRLFDTTHYESVDGKEADADKLKSDRLMARPFEMPHQVSYKTTNCFDDFRSEVSEFKPDLIGLTCTEDMFKLGIKLLSKVRDFGIPVIAGGVFPTFAPDLVLNRPEADIVCRGEGEDALLELCYRMEKGLNYDDIANLWIKQRDGTVKKNPIKMVDISKNPLIDMSIFEKTRFYRPMGGKVYRMFPVETFRGCPYKCAYCNSPSQMLLYRKEAGRSFLRKKTSKNILKELLFYKDTMKAEYLFFWADTFLCWTNKEFDEFCELYQQINLPFWCNTRVETLTKDNLAALKKIGCARISLGIEHGNEEFRRNVLNRKISNQVILEKFKLAEESGIPFSVNNIVGFPHETRDLAFDTIRINRLIKSWDRNAFIFMPFHGTPLRNECERLGLIRHEDIVQSFVIGGSLLDMPQFLQSEVNGLVKTFNMYVKFPESRWPEIRKAEAETPEGQKIYDALRNEFIESGLLD